MPKGWSSRVTGDAPRARNSRAAACSASVSEGGRKSYGEEPPSPLAEVSAATASRLNGGMYSELPPGSPDVLLVKPDSYEGPVSSAASSSTSIGRTGDGLGVSLVGSEGGAVTLGSAPEPRWSPRDRPRRAVCGFENDGGPIGVGSAGGSARRCDDPDGVLALTCFVSFTLVATEGFVRARFRGGPPSRSFAPGTSVTLGRLRGSLMVGRVAGSYLNGVGPALRGT